MRLAGLEPESIVDGPGIRMAIFVSGCSHDCPECHNKEAQNFSFGKKITPRALMKKIRLLIDGEYSMTQGITLTGGDPLYSSTELVKFIKLFKEEYPTKDIWLYTGFIWEEAIKDESMKELLESCDVVVDGPFLIDKKDYGKSFRGSTNQRFIDVQQTVKMGHIVEQNVEFTEY